VSGMPPQEQGARRQMALITGASSGIGYELAKLFARDGYDLALVARDRQKLDALAQAMRRQHGISASVLPADLSLPEAPETVWRALEASPVDVLVNNAGFGAYGAFARTELAEQLRMIQVNATALTHLTRLFLPGMIQRGRGKILNVASTAAFQPGPLMAVYYASKAYVLSFSEAVANELRGSGVSVTALCPGPTTTDFQRRAGIERTRLMRGRIMDAETVARAGYRGLLSGRTVVVPGLRNRLLSVAVRLPPRDAVTQMVRSIQEQRQAPDESNQGDR